VPVKGKSPYNVNVLQRAFKILDAYAEPGQEPDVADLIAKLDIPKSTVHRLLMALEGHGYLERSPLTGKYHLGARLVALGMHAVRRMDLASVAAPFLQRLVDETGETAHLAVLRDGEIISILHAQGRHVLRPPSTVGRRIPIHCTSLGKAILAFLPEDEADALIEGCRFTPYTAGRSPARHCCARSCSASARLAMRWTTRSSKKA
jgi:DNA-binding IclR family transcriptional regulator